MHRMRETILTFIHVELQTNLAGFTSAPMHLLMSLAVCVSAALPVSSCDLPQSCARMALHGLLNSWSQHDRLGARMRCVCNMMT